MACSLVSKYWHHHASKEQIQDFIFRNDKSSDLNVEELKTIITTAPSGPGYYYSTQSIDSLVSWLTYPDNYPPRWKIEDRLFAKQLNKQLIETNLKNARIFCNLLSSNDADFKYLVKIRCKINYLYSKRLSLTDTSDLHSISLDADKLPDADKIEFSRNMECEILMDMTAMNSEITGLSNGVKRIRILDYRPYIAGFPVSSFLFEIIIILMLPCLVVDYFNSTAIDVKFWARLVIAACFEIFAVVVSITDQLPQTNSPTKRRNGIIILVITMSIGALFYRWSLELAHYTAILAGCAVYYMIWHNVLITKYRNSKLIAFIAVCLVILMNDWRFTVDAFKSGEILRTFFYNIYMHLQLGVIFALHNALASYFRYANSKWTDYFTWDQEYRKLYSYGLIVLVFITLYAPTTTAKLFM